MRVMKEIEIIICDGCGCKEVPCTSVTIDDRQWDVCAICLVKLQFVLAFLTMVVDLPIQYSLGSLDSLEPQDVTS